VTVNVPVIAKPCIAQWYVKVPAVVIAIGLLVAPALRVPVSNAPASAVAVWAILSALNHATVWPTRIVAGFGEYERLPFIPTIVIVTLAPPGLGVGVGVGVGEIGLV
jgi:hypothetical protein